jgi:hypothetical protein
MGNTLFPATRDKKKWRPLWDRHKQIRRVGDVDYFTSMTFC